jgi:A/G-specific adenine glycosylase
MGYNRRAIALQACARKMVGEYGGDLPDDTEALAGFPGIGRATACSIAAFAFNRPVVFIETNIRRVFIHFFLGDEVNIPDRDILPLVGKTLSRDNPRVWYWALMDYGAMLKFAVPNPNRRSAHYAKQPKFEGSDREIRGYVLKILTKNGEIEQDTLIRETGKDPQRVLRIIDNLASEGFLCRAGTLIRLGGR